MGEDENGDGGTHLHGGSSGWGVIGDLVTHDFHDVLLKKNVLVTAQRKGRLAREKLTYP